jgi:chromosome segregation ATPase
MTPSRKGANAMKRTLTVICLSIVAALFLSVAGLAQEPVTPAKPRTSRPAQKPDADLPQKLDTPVESPSSDEAMRRTLTSLSSEIDSLNTEIKLLRRATERNSMAIELLLTEERQGKVEDKLDEATQHKVELDAREADIMRRQKNIQQEVTQRGFLRRDEGEALLRTEFQRALDDTRSQQQQAQQRIAELQTQVTEIRTRADSLRRRLERLEVREEPGGSQQQQE